ncbi:hypothetical protein J3R82DRAFT_2029 [Butyriboletus roseoflavus]|nr:hypothetical protein J3R82DRAFT_2029 [Butyriboletus roseoflavus]
MRSHEAHKSKAAQVVHCRKTRREDTLHCNETYELTPNCDKNGASYPYYIPYFDGNEKWPPTEVYEHVDPGLKADRAKPHLLTPEARLEHLSPYFGTEISGIQISQLSEEGLDKLALYAAERKELIFRDQDFKDIGPDRQIELARRFARIHRHTNRLKALVVAVAQSAMSPSTPRCTNEIHRQHPLVRRHPVTGEKALYINSGFVRRIVGFKIEESKYLLRFLYDHISKGADFQIRTRYKPGTVVVWVRSLVW